MRTALGVILALALVGPAFAYDDNTMGMFFSDSDFSDETRNLDTSTAPFNGYVVLLAPTVSTVGGYEVGISLSESGVFVLGASGPNGWTNYGENLNHLVGYGTPLPVYSSGAILGTVQMMYTADQLVRIHFGASDPASMPDVPVIADGSDPNVLIGCNVLGSDGNVASLNAPPPVAEEANRSRFLQAGGCNWAH